MRIPRPASTEYAPFYAPYVDAVPVDADVLFMLEAQEQEVRGIYGNLSEAQAGFRYAEGKWSLKALLGHMTDAERVFSFRALCIGRGEAQALPGFDENAYVATAAFDEVPVAQLLQGFLDARRATLSLLSAMPEAAWGRVGNANGLPMAAKCFPYFCAGHAAHHLNVVRERYLPAMR